MKYIADIVEELRRGVSKGLRITKEDVASKPVELLDEAPERQVEVLEGPLVKGLEVMHRKPVSDVFALDSGSRVIETPYVFIAVGAGSVFSRFSGRGIDVPHTASILGLEEPLCKHIVVVPEVELGEGDASALKSLPGVLSSNPIGVPYTSEYNKHLILVELRLAVENCILSLFHESRHCEPGTVVFVDGPLIYPLHVSGEIGVPGKDRARMYLEGLRELNMLRVRTLTKLVEKGIVVIGIVKRLLRSYYLSSLDPARLSLSKVNDEVYVLTLLAGRGYASDKPLLIGPVKVKHDVEKMNRIVWYVVMPRRLYPLASGLGNHVVYRVEIPENKSYTSEEALNHVFYDSVYTGSLLPLSLLAVDRRVKKITSSIVTYLLYMTGLPGESTGQYISIL
ncbi:MAG: DNA double-strand break repair nuclease NurA [Desulfurococcaceae archaeon]